MIDLWLIIIALLNTLLLLLFDKKFPYNPKERKLFFLHIDSGLTFVYTLASDFLLSMIIAHSMQFMDVKENIILWIICGIHIVADIFILTDRIKCQRRRNSHESVE